MRTNFDKLLLGAVLLSISFLAHPQQANDYFTARSTPSSEQLLKNVEGHHLQQGIAQMQNKRYHAAWNDFDFILRYFPNHPRVLLLMSEVCGKWKSRQCNTEEYYDKALRMSPENSGIHLTKGIYLQKTGKLDEAIDSYRKSIEYNPGSANAHYNLGLAYAAKKQYAQANEHAQQAYALGIPLPGLRDKLVAARAWKPIEAKPAEDPQPPSEAKPEPVGEPKQEESSK